MRGAAGSGRASCSSRAAGVRVEAGNHAGITSCQARSRTDDALSRTASSGSTEWCGADWVNCPWTRDCGLSLAEQARFQDDAALRRRYTRHQGGSNIGFFDGHVAWMRAEDIIANAPDSKDPGKGKLRGIGCTCLGFSEE